MKGDLLPRSFALPYFSSSMKWLTGIESGMASNSRFGTHLGGLNTMAMNAVRNAKVGNFWLERILNGY